MDLVVLKNVVVGQIVVDEVSLIFTVYFRELFNLTTYFICN